MSFISCRRLNKIYPNGVRALRDFSLEIEEGEFVVLVGPSGCGKSTVLRMIAGLEEISTGELVIDGKLSNEVTPQGRDVAMVFQNYALYPHMTVFENMAFGLRLAKLPTAEIKTRVEEAASILGISELLSRKPGQLSGGQKQRVALGRSLVRRPRIFLLDEPLSNVDAKIRQEMRSEILRLHHRLGTTFIYVTHDQIEAMTMGSKIVVMNKGEIQQVGTPFQIFQEPRNLFVATFLGTPQMNIIEANLRDEKAHLSVSFGGDGFLDLPDYKRYEMSDASFLNRKVALGIRPDNVRFVNEKANIVAPVKSIEYFGSEYEVSFALPGSEKPFVVSSTSPVKAGEKMNLKLNEKTIHLFNPETGNRILGVPLFTYLFNVNVTEEGDHFVLHYGKQDLPLDLTGRVIDPSSFDAAVALRFPSSSFHLDKRPGDLALSGKVEHVQDLVREKAVYLHLEDSQVVSFHVLSTDLDKVGANCHVYVSLQDATLYSADRKRCLLAKFPLFPNYVEGKREKGHLSIEGRICGNLDPSFSDFARYVVSLRGADIYVKNPPRAALKCLVLDDQDLGNEILLYLKTAKETYLSLLVPSPFDRHKSPYVYLHFHDDGISPLREKD